MYISLVLCFPFATEFGIFVVYFLDYIVGSAWWVIVLHLVRNSSAEILNVAH